MLHFFFKSCMFRNLPYKFFPGQFWKMPNVPESAYIKIEKSRKLPLDIHIIFHSCTNNLCFFHVWLIPEHTRFLMLQNFHVNVLNIFPNLCVRKTCNKNQKVLRTHKLGNITQQCRTHIDVAFLIYMRLMLLVRKHEYMKQYWYKISKGESGESLLDRV